MLIIRPNITIILIKETFNNKHNLYFIWHHIHSIHNATRNYNINSKHLFPKIKVINNIV